MLLIHLSFNTLWPWWEDHLTVSVSKYHSKPAGVHHALLEMVAHHSGKLVIYLTEGFKSCVNTVSLKKTKQTNKQTTKKTYNAGN